MGIGERIFRIHSFIHRNVQLQYPSEARIDELKGI